MPITTNTIVGVWEVNAPHAPYPWHMMTFTADGHMSQSNPHEGNRGESDSSGQGVWGKAKTSPDSQNYIGKFVEYKASRQDGSPVGKGIIYFALTLHGDEFTGKSAAYRYDAAGTRIAGPFYSPVTGTRVTLTPDDMQIIEGL